MFYYVKIKLKTEKKTTNYSSVHILIQMCIARVYERIISSILAYCYSDPLLTAPQLIVSSQLQVEVSPPNPSSINRDHSAMACRSVILTEGHMTRLGSHGRLRGC